MIVGEEIETETGGELIAYFVTEVVPPGLPVAEAMRRLRDQGAVISISHPLDRLRGSALGERLTLEIIEQVDALEVFNARCLRAGDNQRAAELAKRYGKAVTAGSDAHTLREVGARLSDPAAVRGDPACVQSQPGASDPRRPAVRHLAALRQHLRQAHEIGELAVTAKQAGCPGWRSTPSRTPRFSLCVMLTPRRSA